MNIILFKVMCIKSNGGKYLNKVKIFCRGYNINKHNYKKNNNEDLD